MKKIALIFALVSVSIAVLPLLSMLVAGLVARLFGCELNESDMSVCPTVFGDIGSTLYLMGVFGWLLFYSVPLGICGIVLSAILFAIAALRKKRNAGQKGL